MPSSDLFHEIERIFSANEAVQVLSALRQETLVWESLQQPEFLQAAVERAGNQAQCWNPSRLALLALGDPRSIESLRAEPQALLGPGLQELALQVYQNLQRTGRSPANLREAALLALTLRERRRLTGTWSGMLTEIMPRPGQAETVWRTPLAVLYGMVPDAEEMLRSLLAKNAPPAAFEWVAHAQLSQPVSVADHIAAFTRLMHGMPVSHQLNLLRVISLRGREALAGELAGTLLIGHSAFASLRAQNGVDRLDLAALSSRALALHQMGAFYQLAGEGAQALSLFTAAQSALDQWQSGLYLQQLNLQMVSGARGTGPLVDSDRAARLAASADYLQDELGAVLVSHPYGSSLVKQIPTELESAFLQLKRASAMADREPAVACDLARQGAAGLVEVLRSQGLPFNGDYVYSWRPMDALHILRLLALDEEALELADGLLHARPVDTQLLHAAAEICAGLGRLDAALGYESSAAALDPGNPAWRRALGSLWTRKGEGARAYAEWSVVLSLIPSPSAADRLACAQAALEAKYYPQVVELCEAVLNEDANNGLALGLTGRALIAQDQPQQAVNYLVRSTLLAPENLAPWLALAEVQRVLGEPQRALETLRAAVTAVPEALDGHLALAQACIEAGLLADALPHLKKACQLSPESTRAGLLYGQTLRQLGHTSEAYAVLNRLRDAWAECPELPYETALTLLDLDHAESALPVLEQALRGGLKNMEAQLLYARILLGEYREGEEPLSAETASTRMQLAETALRRVLETDPYHLEALFLQADILREKGELEQALEAYRALTEMPVSAAPELRWRIQWGLGQTAMRLGETGIALAAIKEACQARPDSLPLQRGLAEVSLRANLPHEALEAASSTLQLSPDDVETLSWYASFVAGIGETRQAVDALERAVQIDPHRPDLLVELAHWQISSGDLSAARESLETLKSMDGISRDQLRKAAQIYLRLEDPSAALALFERALQCDAEIPADLLFEVAQLYERLGDHEAALELAQRVLEERPENLPASLLQADLLANLKRPQAALAVLERALRMAEGSAESDGALAPERCKLLGEIHERFTRLLVQEDSLPAALDHAEKALLLDPVSAERCFRAADLALALLQNERAARAVNAFANGEGVLSTGLLQQGAYGLELFCLGIEIVFSGGPEEDLAGWIEEGLSQHPDHPRLLAARARSQARRGALGAARKSFELSRKLLRKNQAALEGLWLAEAALEIQDWKESLDLFERCARQFGGEARAHLGFARALVLAAERQRACEAVRCRGNAPGAQVLDESHRLKFDEAVRMAGRLATSGEVSRWQTRGQVVFAPSANNARALAAMPAKPDDAAALICALRQLNNRAAAVQVARRFANHPLVLFHLALCYLEDASPEGIAAAEQAAAANASQPLARAALAMILRRAGEFSRALEEYENALTIWPDEAEWHDAAGDLCVQAGNIQASILHRKQAVALDEKNARFAFKLGQACLADEDISDAIQILETSAALDPHHADVWLTLATAYHMASRLPQALEAAKQAAELTPSSAEGLLIAGETALSMAETALALDFARGAVRREPENAAAVLFYSNVLVLNDQVEEGLAVLESASPVVKAAFPVAFERGKLIRRLHGPKPALEILEKLAREYPEEPGLLAFLARAQAECGELKSAERNAFKALRLDPNQPELTLMLGRLQRSAGQLDQAVYLLGEAIRMAPTNIEAYLELGAVYQDRREFVLALQVYRQAMRVAPADYQAFYQSGLILRDSKDYPAAENMLRKAADLAPENLTIRRQLVGVIALNLVHNKQEASVL